MPEKFRDELKRIDLKTLNKVRLQREFVLKPYLTVNGRNLLDFSSWDLYNITKLRSRDRTIHQLFEQSGIEVHLSRQTLGTSVILDRLEKRVAKFFSHESALLFPTTKQAWLALVSACVKSGDMILYDENLNAPIADIAYIVEAQSQSFSADDLESLRGMKETCGIFRNLFICFETVSSKTGKIRDLKQLANIAKTMDAELFVEETLAVGTCGIRLAGLFDQLLINKPNATIICDPSFVLQGLGGLLVTDQLLARHLFANSSAFQRDPVLPDFLNELLISSIDHLELQRVEFLKLIEKALFLRNELKILGYKVLSDEALPFIVVAFEELIKAEFVFDYLYNRGFLLEKNIKANDSNNTLKILINTAHQNEHLQLLLQAFLDCRTLM